MSNELFSRNVQRWATYSPASATLLSQINPKEVKTHDTPEEAEKWFLGLELYNVTTLIVYGVGLGYYYKAAKEWLLQNADHQLIFLEDDLDVIYKLFETENGKELIFDNQVWLEFFKGRSANKEIDLSSMPFFFFLGDIEISALHDYRVNKTSQLADLNTHLQYLKNVKLWQLTEHINMGKGFFKNFYRNLLNIPESRLSDRCFKKFEGIPAIICGAGPSLDKNREVLETLKDRALIFAGGSAMNALNETGFLPHFGVGIDPNLPQFSRLLMNQAFETPFFYRLRMFSEALESIKGEHIFIRGSSGYKIASWLEEKLGLTGDVHISEGHNVVNFSFAIAHALGCNPIILVGLDLAYTEQASYAKGVLGHPLYDQDINASTKGISEELLVKNDIYGKPVNTLWKWIMESTWYTDFSLAHPELKIINATEGGIGFDLIPNIPLKTVADEILKKTYDLDLLVHGTIQNAPMTSGVTLENITNALLELEKSLERSQNLCETLRDAYDATHIALVDGVEVPKVNPESITRLHQEDAYTHLLLPFNDSFLSFSGKSFVEESIEDINEEDQAPVQIKKAMINKRRYEFLQAVASYNRTQIKNALDESAIRRSVMQDVLPQKRAIPKLDENGPSIFYSESGKILAQSTYVNGKKEGDAWYFYDSGELYSKQHYVNGLHEGKQEYYFRNGIQKCLLNYNQGRLNGKALLYHANGKLYREIGYKDGKRDGTETLWNLGGVREYEIEYLNGKPVGSAKGWWANGRLAREIKYDEHSKPISIQQWDQEGTLIPQAISAKDDYFDIISKQTGTLTASLQTLCDEIFKLTPHFQGENLGGVIEQLTMEMEKLKELESNLQKEVQGTANTGQESIWKTPTARRMMGKQLEEATKKMAEDIASMEQVIKVTSELIMQDDQDKT